MTILFLLAVLTFAWGIVRSACVFRQLERESQARAALMLAETCDLLVRRHG